MKLTTKGRYAVTAMLDLALRHVLNDADVASLASRCSPADQGNSSAVPSREAADESTCLLANAMVDGLLAVSELRHTVPLVGGLPYEDDADENEEQYQVAVDEIRAARARNVRARGAVWICVASF